MNTQELAHRLFSEGCNAANYSIGSSGTLSEGYYLAFIQNRWQVCYTERGKDQSPIYTTFNEAEACEFYFQHIMAMRQDHCVGFFQSKQKSDALVIMLSEIGVASFQDQIPYRGPSDPRYRVFVTGKAIFAARSALGKLPIRDA